MKTIFEDNLFLNEAKKIIFKLIFFINKNLNLGNIYILIYF